jgi:alpha-tubulin suppressor-like RCC1 family protein
VRSGAALLVLLGLTACSSEPSTSGSGAGAHGSSGGAGGNGVEVRGGLEKGPFILGSTIELSALSADGTPTGLTFNTETTSDAGDFVVSVPSLHLVSVQGSGFYFNELTASLSESSLTLRSLGDVSRGGRLYVNPVTHLVHNRVLSLVQGGASAPGAEDQAETELRAALGIGPSGFLPHASAVETTLLQGDDDASAYLFAVGAILLQAASTEAGPAGPVDATFQELLNTISTEFTTMGQLSSKTKSVIHAAECSLDADAAMAHLAARFDAIGVDSAVPNLHRVLDCDGDNIPDIDDNCPHTFNPDQADSNGDGVGDACEPCSDGIKNGHETDVDCGGGTCPACAAGRACRVASDCATKLCLNGVCKAPPTCSDGLKDGHETDVDCGGSACPPCAKGKGCVHPSDCGSQLCVDGVCVAPPTCNDGVKNGSETDVDCGGTTCPPCADGLGCSSDPDCVSGQCVGAVCQPSNPVGCGTRLAHGPAHYHFCATNAGTLWCWGDNTSGELGDGTTTGHVCESGAPCEPGPVEVIAIGDLVVNAVLGVSHTCAWKQDGEVWCWGANSLGQLGNGTTTGPDCPGNSANCRATPAPVVGLPAPAVQLAGGLAHTVALLQDGTVWWWGSMDYASPHVCGRTSVPIQIPLGAGVVEVTAGLQFSCAVKVDGSVWCWGANESGELGNGSAVDPPTCSPVQVTGLDSVVDVSAGYQHVCARRQDGTLWCWGANTYGNLGTGVQGSSQTSPVQASAVGTGVVEVSSGGYGACVRKGDGTVWCWGYGTMGDGSAAGEYATPVQVAVSADVVQLSSGERATCLMKQDGTVWCWGPSSGGEIGNGTLFGGVSCSGCGPMSCFCELTPAEAALACP